MQGNRYAYEKMKDDVTYEVRVERRLTRLETKMNLIAFVSGATFLSLIGALIMHVV